MNAVSSTASGWVVVGIDGSPESNSAVRYAVEEARRRSGGVRLVHAMPTLRPGAGPRAIAGAEPARTGRELVASARLIAQEQWAQVPVQTRLETGDRRRAILGSTDGAFEIVLGHDARLDLARLATGSTVLGVAAHASIPVIAVAPGPRAESHRRLGVGVKAPEASFGLLKWSFELAAERGVTLWVVHAWDLPVGYGGLIAEDEREKVTRSVTEPIERDLRRLAPQYPQVEHKLTVVQGNPALTLEELSRECDLLGLARREKGLPRGHIGGTARALLRHAHCPVMFLPPAVRVPEARAEAEGQPEAAPGGPTQDQPATDPSRS